MRLSIRLESGERFDADRMKAVENALFNVRIFTLQLANNLFDFLALARAGAIFIFKVLFCHTASALDKAQIVGAAPGDDIVFVNLVQRADERHSRIILTAKHREHPLQLRSVEHAHHGRFDYIGKVMP